MNPKFKHRRKIADLKLELHSSTLSIHHASHEGFSFSFYSLIATESIGKGCKYDDCCSIIGLSYSIHRKVQRNDY